MEPRYDELFTLIQAELRRSGFEELIAAGVVLTGGTSKMEGVVELAEEIFHMPVRIGTPVNVKGLSDIVNNPIYSTGVGLLHFGAQAAAQRKCWTSQVKGRRTSCLERLKAGSRVVCKGHKNDDCDF